jgi:ribosomal protein S18 acetylase RimI-like enzyme
MLIAAWDGWRGNMYRLGVLPEYRRRGIGSDLVRAGERHLRSRGAHRVVAAVGQENVDATEFWRAVGYEIQDVHRLVKDLD